MAARDSACRDSPYRRSTAAPGFGYVDLGIVFEETGRALLCAPYFATVALAAEPCCAASDESARARPPAGHRVRRDGRHARAHRGRAAGWDEPASGSPPATRARGWRLPARRPTSPTATSPTCSWSPPAPPPASASSPSTADAPGLARTPLPTLDQTRKQARLDFDGHPRPPAGHRGRGVARPRTRPSPPPPCCSPPNRSGSGRRAGRGRGLRQDPRAVRTADRLVPGDQAQVRRHAAWRSSPPARPRTADCGRWTRATRRRPPSRRPSPRPSAPRRSRKVAGDNIQVHGGIGFTWEHPAHLYFKRAKSSEVLLGTPSYHRELLAARLGI